MTSLVTVSQGQIGYVFARDGESLAPIQALARAVKCSDYQDVRAFLSRRLAFVNSLSISTSPLTDLWF